MISVTRNFLLLSSYILFHNVEAEEPISHVYGSAGTAESFYHGVEKSFGESKYDNPELDVNPDPHDPLIYEKGTADATSSNVIYPMAQAGEGVPSDPENIRETQKPEGELNTLNPVSTEYVSQRRGSQLTSIGAGSGSPDDVVKETRKGFYHKRRLLLLLEKSRNFVQLPSKMNVLKQRLNKIEIMAKTTLLNNIQNKKNEQLFANNGVTTTVSTRFHKNKPNMALWKLVKRVEEKNGKKKMTLLEESTGKKSKENVKQQWFYNSMEGGDVGSGLAIGSSRIATSSPFDLNNGRQVVPFLRKSTVGLDQLEEEKRDGPTTGSLYPKWMSTIGSDPIISPQVSEAKQRIRGSDRPGNGWIDDHLPTPITSVGSGVGEKVDKYGFPIV